MGREARVGSGKGAGGGGKGFASELSEERGVEIKKGGGMVEGKTERQRGNGFRDGQARGLRGRRRKDRDQASAL